MVKNLLKIIFLFFFLFSHISYGSEKEPILDNVNKNIIKKHFQKIKLIGEANYSFLFWNVYDAQLYSPEINFNKKKFALILRYNKEIKKELLVNETIEDMKKQKILTEEKIKNWTNIFNSIYQKVTVGSRFLCIKLKKDKSIFFYNGKKLLESNNEEFIELFFNIWLRNDSKNPSFSKKLLGKL